MKILIATKNLGKVKEIEALSEEFFPLEEMSFLLLKSFEKQIEVEENGCSFYENAYIKAREYSRFYKMPVIADDSGLVVPALKGEPGIYSSRYAGENAKDEENIEKLLFHLKDIKEKKAYFQCSAVFYASEKVVFHTEGRLIGEIIHEKRGEKGFGYDPVFFLPEKQMTLAEISLKEKNQISHRRQAFYSLFEKIKQWRENESF